MVNDTMSGRLQYLAPVAGGSINHCYRARTEAGETVFVKENADAPADFFAAEASGLRALADAGAPVPRVLDWNRDCLMLEWVDGGRPAKEAMASLGRIVAAMHETHGPSFGFERDNYCGLTPQLNHRHDDPWTFFAECRLLPQGRWARDRGLLDGRAMERLEALCERLPELIPWQPPSLIHGDLWAGNMMFDERGEPLLIDPAASWSPAEADLAMTRLFGGFDAAFYRAYHERRPLEPGFEERVPIYNLYHLLNHLNLFGGSYRASVIDILRRY